MARQPEVFVRSLEPEEAQRLVRIIMCDLCDSTVILGNVLAAEQVPDAAALWLAGHGWTGDAAERWVCGCLAGHG